jgi:methyl-accepting chemotaxis protein
MKNILASTLLATCIALVFVLAIIHFAPISDIIISHSKYVPAKEFKELDQYEQIVIARMMKEKSIITVDTLWSLQVSFYQTIISVLIALNAVVVGGAFVVIRSSSKAEVVKQSIVQFEEFSKSNDFTKVVQRKAKKELSKINATYGDMIDALAEHDARIKASEGDIRQVISRLADMDVSESCTGSDDRITE